MTENTRDMKRLLIDTMIKISEGKITPTETDAIIRRSQQFCKRKKLELDAAKKAS